MNLRDWKKVFHNIKKVNTISYVEIGQHIPYVVVPLPIFFVKQKCALQKIVVCNKCCKKYPLIFDWYKVSWNSLKIISNVVGLYIYKCIYNEIH